MLRARNIGCAQSPSLVLSSRASICRLREANCWRMVVFTRNPFRVDLRSLLFTFRRRGNTRDFEFFQKIHLPKPERFAWLRARIPDNSRNEGDGSGLGKSQEYAKTSTSESGFHESLRRRNNTSSEAHLSSNP